jgi:hypothetical protein
MQSAPEASVADSVEAVEPPLATEMEASTTPIGILATSGPALESVVGAHSFFH